MSSQLVSPHGQEESQTSDSQLSEAESWRKLYTQTLKTGIQVWALPFISTKVTLGLFSRLWNGIMMPAFYIIIWICITTCAIHLWYLLSIIMRYLPIERSVAFSNKWAWHTLASPVLHICLNVTTFWMSPVWYTNTLNPTLLIITHSFPTNQHFYWTSAFPAMAPISPGWESRLSAISDSSPQGQLTTQWDCPEFPPLYILWQSSIFRTTGLEVSWKTSKVSSRSSPSQQSPGFIELPRRPTPRRRPLSL